MPVDVCKYKYGRLLYLTNDIYMGRMLRDYGEYSDEEVKIFQQIVRPVDVVIEAGANIGCFTVPLAKMAHTVFAFEPQLMLYHILCGNIALNGLRNVNALNMAVGSEDGGITVPNIDYDLPNNFGGLALGNHENGRQVGMIALDSFIDSFPDVRLIKADVEGMETEVLLGAQKLISKFRPFLYLENDRQQNSERLLNTMLDLGYKTYSHRPKYVSNLDCSEDLKSLVSMNILGVPAELGVTVNDLEQLTAPSVEE